MTLQLRNGGNISLFSLPRLIRGFSLLQNEDECYIHFRMGFYWMEALWREFTRTVCGYLPFTIKRGKKKKKKKSK